MKYKLSFNFTNLFSYLRVFKIDAPVEELQEKDAIPLGETEDRLQLPMEKVLTTPAVRRMAMEHKVLILECQ